MMLFADDVNAAAPVTLPGQVPQPAQAHPAVPPVLPEMPRHLAASIEEAASTPTCGKCLSWREVGNGTCDFLGMACAASERACTAFVSRKS